MRERFMKVFAYYRLKKFKEPLVCNLSRPDFSSNQVDGTNIEEFEKFEKEVDNMRMKQRGIAIKSENIAEQIDNLIKHVQGDVISDLDTVKEESDRGNVSDDEDFMGVHVSIRTK